MLHKYSIFIAALSFFFLASCNNQGNSKTEKPETSLQFASNDAGLQLPEGFHVVLVAQDIGRARHIAIRKNGDMYVSLNSRDKGGSIAALRDTSGDGKADIIEYFGDLVQGTGIGIHDGYLYYGSDTAIVRYKLKPDSLLPNMDAELIASLPVQHEHEAKSIAFDNQGNLFVNVGAPSNCCQVKDRVKGSLGQDPCPLLEFHGGIWRFSADKPNQTQENGGERYVTGIRNCVALAWNPEVNKLFAVMHGRDQLHEFYPQYYTEKQSSEVPAEEFIRFEEGGNYGWPYVYYDQIQKKMIINPEYGGDGKKAAPSVKYKDPIMAFPGHWAPNGLLFYTGKSFPNEYQNGAFVAFHGSWNRAPLPQEGFKVVFVPFKEDAPSGDYSTFADGFKENTAIKSEKTRYRPCGLAQGNDGSLYVTDDAEGTIFQIVYTGK